MSFVVGAGNWVIQAAQRLGEGRPKPSSRETEASTGQPVASAALGPGRSASPNPETRWERLLRWFGVRPDLEPATLSFTSPYAEPTPDQPCVSPWCGWCQAAPTPGPCEGHRQWVRERSDYRLVEDDDCGCGS